MKRNVIWTLSLLVLSLMVSAGAYAQDATKANVPFDFTVGKAHLPAGTYVVRGSDNPGFIAIRNVESRSSILTLASRGEAGYASPRLVFNKVGGQYFLAQVWGAPGNDGMILAPTSLEKELRSARGGAGDVVSIAMQK